LQLMKATDLLILIVEGNVFPHQILRDMLIGNHGISFVSRLQT